MESYILKLYRNGHSHDSEIAGLLEEVLSGRQLPFRDFGELRKLLLSGALTGGGGAESIPGE